MEFSRIVKDAFEFDVDRADDERNEIQKRGILRGQQPEHAKRLCQREGAAAY
jgi:hypothetical protein